jgi:hypothetical protein
LASNLFPTFKIFPFARATSTMMPFLSSNLLSRGKPGPALRVLALVLAAVTIAEPALASKARNIYGRVELVKIEGVDAPLSTKMDTGARTSSLHAINIRRFKRAGAKWVAFDVPVPNSKTIVHFEKPLERVTRIKNRNGESLVVSDGDMFSERPEIRLTVCLRNEPREISVNLVDRSHFVHPVLFGATAIEEFEGLIDPSMRHPVEPFCTKSPSTKKVASR